MMCRVFPGMVLSLCVTVGMMTNPQVILSPDPVRVAVGSSVQIQCAIVHGSVQHLGVTWNSNHGEILTHSQSDGVTRDHTENEKVQSYRDLRHNSYILTIRDMEASNSGRYHCDIVGKNTLNSVNTVTVSVQGRDFPVPAQSPMLNVRVSQTAAVNCSVPGIDLDKTDLHWHRRNLTGYQWVVTHRANGIVEVNKHFQGHFNSTSDIASRVATLIVTNIQPEDATVYYCKVWGDVYGNGTQINIIGDESLNLFPIILGCVLAVLLLLVIAVIIVLYVKRWACFTTTSKPNRSNPSPQSTSCGSYCGG
ncbi:uncharacterized protein LOC125455034 isoform X2 [Stegostoma tigrinum]|uniref:uncharacterized protein LOC125455034 isoform X2 n=1 Tax=Stegostoma tigrinum TaxID=3053191 RepID=UPI00286FB241|nr:uncharacterized protein LOC125455034 isoform X2 [Stegostoma tigrinum]